MKEIKVEIYKNGKLENELNTSIEDLANTMAAAIQGAGKAKIKQTNIDTADLIYTFSYQNYEGREAKYKYIYKGLPCTAGRIDTNKLRG